MKNKIVKNIWLGVFVSIGILLFFIGIYFVGQKQHMFSSTFRLSSLFSDVSGLQVGNNVRFAGINMGTIESIEIINDTTVRVDMIMDESLRKFIRKDAKASIGSEGLMGNKVVSITPGTTNAKEVKNNDFIMAIPPINLDEVFLKLMITADNAAIITSDLADIIGNIHNGNGTIGKLLMDSTFASNIDKTVINLRQGTGGFKQNMDAAKNSFLLKGFLRSKKSKSKSKSK